MGEYVAIGRSPPTAMPLGEGVAIGKGREVPILRLYLIVGRGRDRGEIAPTAMPLGEEVLPLGEDGRRELAIGRSLLQHCHWGKRSPVAFVHFRLFGASLRLFGASLRAFRGWKKETPMIRCVGLKQISQIW